ncbi:MAG TPA: queuosine precursor transporter [Anaerolineales bacterium]|nr:queuosine precursor transporter [Anaerolineales bacterium]
METRLSSSGRWYPAVVAVFVTALIVSNIIAVKLVSLFGLTVPSAILLFPVAYICGDVLTEVYGYGAARRAIWIGFGCNAVAVAAIVVAGRLPPSPYWTPDTYTTTAQAQRAYDAILGFAPRLLAASFAAFLVGEFLNAYVMAKMKVATGGRRLWMRTIGSTLVGEGADSLVFLTLAFGGILPPPALASAIASQWLLKSAYEAIATPLTYLVVNRLKRAEGLDPFDRSTDFNPLHVA